MDIERLVKEIQEEKIKGRFQNYIEYMQFPKYKNLKENTRIDFSFPLTMLVGKNGTGKSSVLHAIYGAPSGQSTGDFWFSTQVDPIKDGENKYFYGYKADKNSSIKEVVKKRQPSIKAFDYWETAALNTKIGMVADDNMDKGSRNSPVDKNVVLFDFRGELSAFDKYFYFYKSKSDKIKRKFEQKNKENKQFIIQRSPLLRRIFLGENKVTFPNHPENCLHDKMEIYNMVNNAKILNEINNILGKQYVEIRRVYHRVYESWGTSVLVKTKDGMSYSEANAGSGENAIINMVCTVLSAPNNSLILLDEPEVSLHPSAQKKLKIFLLQIIKKYHHQIVLSTHSNVLIEGMPKDALKLFEMTENAKINVTNGVYSSEAFYNIKEEVKDKYLIICEDVSAKTLIEGVLRKMGLIQHFKVEPRHGGADTLITRYLPIFALDRTIYENVFIILDGDKEPDDIIPYSKIPNGEMDDVVKIEKYIKNLTSSYSAIKPLIDGNKQNGGDEYQKLQVYKEYLEYAEHHLYFLPKKMIPEAIVLSDVNVQKNTLLDQNDIIIDNSNAKDYVKKICLELFTDESKMEACFDLLTKQWVTSCNQEYQSLEKILQDIFEYCNSGTFE